MTRQLFNWENNDLSRKTNSHGDEKLIVNRYTLQKAVDFSFDFPQ